jgi:UDP-glucose:(heptosyl)LPS alpha-1,3-glucosyltransferase
VERHVKIALVHPKFDRSGGAERYALGLATGLSGRGHEVHLFGRRAAGLGTDPVFHRVPSVPFGRALKTYSFDRLTRGAVKPGQFEIVQGFGKTTCQTVHRTGGGVHRAYLEREGRGRMTAYDRVVLRIEDALFSSHGLRAVICPSSWVKAEVCRFYPTLADRVRIIPNGVNLATFFPAETGAQRKTALTAREVPADAPALLFVATNFRLKGLDLAVGALALLPGAHLVVAGNGDPGPFRTQAQGLGCADRVHFLGAVEDPGSLYRAGDVLLHPTRYDPFANVCLEAMACGTPVVTTPENGAADLLGEARGGTSVARDAGPSGLASAVQDLLSRGERGRAEARAVASANGQEQHLDRVEALYRELVAAGRSAGGAPR